MIDFKIELDKLLELETATAPQTALEGLAASEVRLLTALNKKQADVSMQIEEIYDMVREIDTAEIKEKLGEEKKRSKRFLEALILLSDIIEDFSAYAAKSGEDELKYQSEMMMKNAGRIIENLGMVRLGEINQSLDTEIHTVKGTARSKSGVPEESVTEVLQSGYRYMGSVVRKAAVILSLKTEEGK